MSKIIFTELLWTISKKSSSIEVGSYLAKNIPHFSDLFIKCEVRFIREFILGKKFNIITRVVVFYNKS